MPDQITSQMLMQRLLQMQSQGSPEMDDFVNGLASQAKSAQLGADIAGDKAQSLRDAPPPETSSLADLVTRAFGSMASTFQGNRKPLDEANAMIDNERKQLMVKRMQDLAHLDDVYGKSAERAAKLGDLAAQEKYLALKDKNHQTREELMHMIDYKLREEGEQSKAQARAQAAEQKLNDMVTFDPSGKIQYSPISGFPYIPMDASFPTGKAKDTTGKVGDTKLIASNFADATKKGAFGAANGPQFQTRTISPAAKNALDMAGMSMENIADMEKMILPKLPMKWSSGQRLMNALGAKSQADPILSSYGAYRTAAIQIIQTIASLGHGLRINQAEIQAALQFDLPRETDTRVVAQNKLNVLKAMIRHVERAASGQPIYTSPADIRGVIDGTRGMKGDNTISNPTGYHDPLDDIGGSTANGDSESPMDKWARENLFGK